MQPITRRTCLQTFGGIALAELLRSDSVRADEAKTHHKPKVQRVVQLFMLGGASQLDTFDYKPELIKRHGERVKFTVSGGTEGTPGPLLKSPWNWKQHGQSGRWVSSALPNIAKHVDDLAFFMSMYAPTSEHGSGQTMQTSGFLAQGFPSVGAWVSYGLGRIKDNVPQYVAFPEPDGGMPWNGKGAWGNGFLPASSQATTLNPTAATPVPDLFAPKGGRFEDATAQKEALDLLNTLNDRHRTSASDDSRLTARMASYELAAKMQLSLPALMDLSGETAATLKLYGIDQPATKPIGTNCLIARRLLEKGTRFVQLWVGSSLGGSAGNWDNHGDVRPGSDFEKMCVRSDLPIAGFLTDLKQRGLWDSTLVIWTTEFGRTPYSQGGHGRDHNGNTFVSWMGGGGVKGGSSFGASDSFGYGNAEGKTMSYDVHATMLHLLGIDHEKLTFRHNGADRRLTDVHGRVVNELLS
jgi:hypothetical protein